MKNSIRTHKKKRIRSRIVGDAHSPRLAVFRSSKHIYAQLIDDNKGITLAAAADNATDTTKKTKTERAYACGEAIATKAHALKIKVIRFDRGGFLYHGRVKALADGARAGGLQF